MIRTAAVLLLALLGGWGLPHAACGQSARWSEVNEETTVRAISFLFPGDQTFTAERLKAQIETQAPSFWDRLRDRLDGVLWFLDPPVYRFDPVTLQKDVVRLRRFYQQNGFLNPFVDYPASQYNPKTNTFHVIFTIREGPALTIRSVSFRGPDATTAVQRALAPSLHDAWQSFRQTLNVSVGRRYTTFNELQIADQTATWLQNHGYAFARVSNTAHIDSAATAVDLRFTVRPGPRGTFSELIVDGNESVTAAVVRREVPFALGDTYAKAKLQRGQQELFSLNLFRVALADLPPQPEDSTVTVRYRVREAELRSITAQLGYGAQTGVRGEGTWTHRNFFGAARLFNVGLVAETGLPENPDGFLPAFLSGAQSQVPTERLFRVSTLLRQPFISRTQLAGSVELFALQRLNPKLLTDNTRFLGLNERQFGLNTELTYTLLPFRTVSLRHTFNRTKQFTSQRTDAGLGLGDDFFDKSILSLSATLGRTDDYLNPRRGFLIEPGLEVAGTLLGSDIQFLRLSNAVTGYYPLTPNINVAGRLFGGFFRPLQGTRGALTLPARPSLDQLRRNVLFENRLDDFLFYAGGGTDVRGWPAQLAGGKFARDRSLATDSTVIYEPTGGTIKLGANLEMRLPFPGLSSDWQTAVFVDAAYLGTDGWALAPDPSVAPNVYPTRSSQGQVRVGAGVGLRYRTPFGFLRLDLAAKVNPGPLDLRRPGDVVEAVRAGRPITAAPTQWVRRFRVHFGIGRTF
ncbi:BamA/OMP85 family outer membrane protein [Salisaeta longa]|uniref:BamA/OMP85 family outer membrane protein n=1 Tax=Salisaeta longa TaxID=503170 RepID=UPI0003B2F0CB|nr:BamA/TamA family outer membrane protein [Salisaeta longa]